MSPLQGKDRLGLDEVHLSTSGELGESETGSSVFFFSFLWKKVSSGWPKGLDCYCLARIESWFQPLLHHYQLKVSSSSQHIVQSDHASSHQSFKIR